MKYFYSLFFVLLFSSTSSVAESIQPAVATAHPLATKAGIEILKKGGNAFDAAAAITASLAVVEPYGSGIGGGGFWLIHRAYDNKQVMIDGREKAPMRAHKDMYLDKSGNVIKGLSINGPLSAAIPGVPAGIVHLTKKYGRLTLKENLSPAIKQAKEGFTVTQRYVKLMRFRKKVINHYADSAAIFLRNHDIPSIGYSIVQEDLAKTLMLLAEQGRDGFYTGIIAKKLVDGVKENGGIWELDDLKNYNLVEREPIVSYYDGIKITSATLPSSGGIVMAQVLSILEHLNFKQFDSLTQTHILVEAMRRAYRDRAAYLGDMDFVDVPIARLLDEDYIAGMALTIDLDKATPSNELGGITVAEGLGADTTHFSVIDAKGNRVSATLSINLPFGSGFVAAGTGVLLNNEMDDFSIKPLTANAYGLVGHTTNAIAPGKRPLSSMSPTFVETDKHIGILGTPGGSRIISMVLLGILDFANHKLPQSWVRVSRYHHQYLPDEILFEKGGFSVTEQQQLKHKGHRLKEAKRQYGNMQAIMVWKEKNTSFAASDPRGEGAAEVIYLSK